MERKWKDVFNKCSNNESIIHVLNHDVIPYIAGYGIKKLFNRVTIKCQACRNKSSYGHGNKLKFS